MLMRFFNPSDLIGCGGDINQSDSFRYVEGVCGGSMQRGYLEGVRGGGMRRGYAEGVCRGGTWNGYAEWVRRGVHGGGM